MKLPSFLGIGAQKCGTSWLASALSTHPDLYLPPVARELHYFNLYFERGPDWYAEFFADAPANARGIGEITPSYIFDPNTPARIAETLPDCRLIAMLRDPVSRLQSHYQMAYAQGRFSGGVKTFLESDETAVARGLYSTQLKRYLTHFSQDQLLVLIFEDIFSSPRAMHAALCEIAEFLNIDPEPFASFDVARRVNDNAGVPRFRRGYAAAITLRQRLRDRNMNWLLNAIQALGLKRGIFGANTPPPVFTPEERKLLRLHYIDEAAALETLLQRELPAWSADDEPGAGKS